MERIKIFLFTSVFIIISSFAHINAQDRFYRTTGGETIFSDAMVSFNGSDVNYSTFDSSRIYYFSIAYLIKR